MDTDFTLEREFAAAADDLLKKTLSKAAVRSEAHSTPHCPALWASAAGAGWFDAVIDAESGGSGLDVPVLSGLFESLGRHLASGPFVDNAVIAPMMFAKAGDKLRDQLGAAARGESIIVFLDPSASGQETANAPILTDGTLTGVVELARHAPLADAFLVVATAPGDKTTVAYVDVSAPGVTVTEQRSLDPVTSYGRVVFDTASVTPDYRIESLEASTLVDDVRAAARVMISRELAGLTRHMLDAAVSYAKEREQFGKPIGAFQPVQQILSSMTSDVLMLEAISAEAARRLNPGAIDTDYAMLAKSYASECARRVGESALQVHGGIAFTSEFELHRWFLHILSLQGMYGDESELGQLIGHHLLDGTLEP